MRPRQPGHLTVVPRGLCPGRHCSSGLWARFAMDTQHVPSTPVHLRAGGGPLRVPEVPGPDPPLATDGKPSNPRDTSRGIQQAPLLLKLPRSAQVGHRSVPGPHQVTAGALLVDGVALHWTEYGRQEVCRPVWEPQDAGRSCWRPVRGHSQPLLAGRRCLCVVTHVCGRVQASAHVCSVSHRVTRLLNGRARRWVGQRLHSLGPHLTLLHPHTCDTGPSRRGGHVWLTQEWLWPVR